MLELRRVGKVYGTGATAVHALRDVDLDLLAEALAPFGVDVPETVAVAVQDHGFRPGAGNNAVRL